MNKMSLHCHTPLMNATAHARKESCYPYIEHLWDSCSQCRSLSPFSFFSNVIFTHMQKDKRCFSYTDKDFSRYLYFSSVLYVAHV